MSHGDATGLYDRNGEMIRIGDRIRFFPCPAGDDGCIWDGTVTYEDGVVTASAESRNQVANPRGWDRSYDWIYSRSAIDDLYIDCRAWDKARQPLTMIHSGFGYSHVEFEEHYRPIARKFGWGKRYLNVEVLHGEENAQSIE